MHKSFTVFLPVILFTGFASGCGNKMMSYAGDIKPLLEKNCFECHLPGGAGHAASGLSMDSYESLMKGTRFGPVIVPKDAASSTLVRLISGTADPSIRMPHGDRKPLAAKDIEKIAAWINQGAKNN